MEELVRFIVACPFCEARLMPDSKAEPCQFEREGGDCLWERSYNADWVAKNIEEILKDLPEGTVTPDW